MFVVVPEPVSMNILEHGYIEEELTGIMLAILRPGMVLFDVGAHFGYYSLLGSWLVGDSGSVIAFEPTPSSRDVLHANTDDVGNISVEAVAVWSTAGRRTFRDFGREYSAFNSFFEPRLSGVALSSKEVVVATVTIDAFIEAFGIRPDVVKIDAESSEMEILRGMKQTLSSVRPAITLETGDVGVEGVVSTSECIAHLRSSGYLPFESSGNMLGPHSPRSSYRHENLLFVPEERVPTFLAAST